MDDIKVVLLTIIPIGAIVGLAVLILKYNDSKMSKIYKQQASEALLIDAAQKFSFSKKKTYKIFILVTLFWLVGAIAMSSENPIKAVLYGGFLITATTIYFFDALKAKNSSIVFTKSGIKVSSGQNRTDLDWSIIDSITVDAGDGAGNECLTIYTSKLPEKYTGIFNQKIDFRNFDKSSTSNLAWYKKFPNKPSFDYIDQQDGQYMFNISTDVFNTNPLQLKAIIEKYVESYPHISLNTEGII